VIVEVNVEPFTSCSLGFLRCQGNEPFPHALPAGAISYQSVFDERVCLTVPDHVDEADKGLVIAGCDPAQAVAREQASQSISS
jgi:hypothetical protein